MKKIFLLIFCLFYVNSAFATVGDELFYTWEGVKSSASDGWKWTKYAVGRAVEKGVNITDTVSQKIIGAPSIDEKLLPYVSGADLDTMIKNGADFKFNSAQSLAGYQAAKNNIQVGDAFFKTSHEYGQTLVHHEVQHLKDAISLKNAGYSATDQGHVGTLTLDGTSQGILQAILEARAYGEEIVFAYQNKELYKNNLAYEKAYQAFVKEYDFANAFDKAIQSGKTVEEARHQAEISFLNSDFFKKGYLDNWVNQKSDKLLSLSVEEILKILNDKKLSKEDIYTADKFWKNLCSYENTKGSDECLAYFARRKVYCADLEKKWGSCRRLAATLAGDKIGGRFFTDDTDDALYDACCE